MLLGWDKNDQSAWLGDDQLDPTKTETYDAKLVDSVKSLRPYLCKDAKIILWACNVGQNPGFVQRLADLTGATVEATTAATDGAIWGQGTWVSKSPSPPPGSGK